ncbi:FxsA family protein [Blastococcus sp. SYSU D00820]
MARRIRTVAALLALAEIVVLVLVASQIGAGWTILLTLGTSALGLLLLASQGTRALRDLRERAREHRPAGRALGDAGLVAVGGLLMLLPGLIGDVLGLLCLLPPTRPLVRALLGRLLVSRLPEQLRGPVQVRSTRTAGVRERGEDGRGRPLVIEGEVVRDPDPDRPA